jgi:hypothetical protein
MARRKRRRELTVAEQILDTGDASLLDVVDNARTKGVVLNGDLTLALANVDLVYAHLSLLLAAADRVSPGESPDFLRRRRQRTRPSRTASARQARRA